MKVLLVTTWATACGIAEHSAMLKEAVQAADPTIDVQPCPGYLDADQCLLTLDHTSDPGDVVHLNYQASLHSRWTPDQIQRVQRIGRKVLVTYHDTGVPNSDQCLSILRAADAGVVHEPCDDIIGDPELGPKVRYWRMGVPGWSREYVFDTKRRPMLGSIGFPFPWKNYDALAAVTEEAGWNLLLIAPGATAEQEARWKSINPRTSVCSTFLPRELAIEWLAGCDATAFLYVCHNTGQSAAILQGIAARKPVIALRACRQFRALYDEYPGSLGWAETMGDVLLRLKTTPIARVDPRTVYVAEQDSWERLGQKYAALYRSLVA